MSILYLRPIGCATLVVLTSAAVPAYYANQTKKMKKNSKFSYAYAPMEFSHKSSCSSQSAYLPVGQTKIRMIISKLRLSQKGINKNCRV